MGWSRVPSSRRGTGTHGSHSWKTKEAIYQNAEKGPPTDEEIAEAEAKVAEEQVKLDATPKTEDDPARGFQLGKAREALALIRLRRKQYEERKAQQPKASWTKLSIDEWGVRITGSKAKTPLGEVIRIIVGRKDGSSSVESVKVIWSGEDDHTKEWIALASLVKK